MDRLWDAIDLSECVGTTLRVVKRMTGVQAAVMFVSCFILLVGFTQLAWVYDLKSTYDVVGVFATQISSNLPYNMIKYSAYTILALTFVPSIFELSGVAFAREGGTPWQVGVIGLSIFDMVTDTPMSLAFVNYYWPSIENSFGIMAYPVYWLFWGTWLFLSSFGFELLTICLAVACIVLLFNMFKGKKDGR